MSSEFEWRDLFAYGVIGLVVAAALWGCWRIWLQGVEEAKQFDRKRRLEAGRCPECGYDLRGKRRGCPECGWGMSDVEEAATPPPEPPSEFDLELLRSDWPDAHIAAVPPQPWEQSALLYSTEDGWLVNLVVDQLTARGVWVTVQDRREQRVQGAVAVTLVHHQLVVPESERDRAEAILNRFRNPAPRGDINSIEVAGRGSA